MSARAQALRLVREGYELHYGKKKGTDPDLSLLDGDRLYAAGLEELARGGDVEAVAALADLISDCARAAAEGRPAAAEKAWARTATRLGVTGFTSPQSAER